MKDKIKKSLVSIGGKNIKVEESKKSRQNNHKKFFINTLNTLVTIQERSENLFTQYGINTIMYEDLYFQVIEDLVYEHFGSAVAEVMFWWVSNLNEMKKEDFFIEDEKTGKKYKVKTPTQIYNVIKKLKIFKNI
jgi:hypothetical protein